MGTDGGRLGGDGGDGTAIGPSAGLGGEAHPAEVVGENQPVLRVGRVSVKFRHDKLLRFAAGLTATPGTFGCGLGEAALGQARLFLQVRQVSF